MKFALSFVVFAAIVAVAFSAEKKKPTQKPCIKVCPDDYKPVCGKEGNDDKKVVTFGSACIMENYKCESGKEFSKVRDGECGGNAPVRLS